MDRRERLAARRGQGEMHRLWNCPLPLGILGGDGRRANVQPLADREDAVWRAPLCYRRAADFRPSVAEAAMTCKTAGAKLDSPSRQGSVLLTAALP
jgi:hypothetical protein